MKLGVNPLFKILNTTLSFNGVKGTLMDSFYSQDIVNYLKTVSSHELFLCRKLYQFFPNVKRNVIQKMFNTLMSLDEDMSDTQIIQYFKDKNEYELKTFYEQYAFWKTHGAKEQWERGAYIWNIIGTPTKNSRTPYIPDIFEDFLGYKTSIIGAWIAVVLQDMHEDKRKCFLMLMYRIVAKSTRTYQKGPNYTCKLSKKTDEDEDEISCEPADVILEFIEHIETNYEVQRTYKGKKEGTRKSSFISMWIDYTQKNHQSYLDDMSKDRQRRRFSVWKYIVWFYFYSTRDVKASHTKTILLVPKEEEEEEKIK